MTANTKICLVFPNPIATIPAGFTYVGKRFKRRGFDVNIHINTFRNFRTMERIMEEIIKPYAPDIVGISSERLERVVPLIEETIANDDIPGAVFLVGRKGKIIMREAFGYSQTVPEQEKMKPDMIFDLASITKPMATAASVN